MTEFVIPSAVSFLITFLAVFPTITLAKKYQLVDDPTKRPHPAHIHRKTTPLAGGLPIFLGIFISLLIFVPFDQQLIGITLGGLVLLISGLLDDYWVNLSPYPRLLLQFSAAGLVVASGLGITFITNPLGGILRFNQIALPGNFFIDSFLLFPSILALIWIVWVMNMVNWSWGVDGQIPGIITVAALCLGIISLRFYNAGDLSQFNNIRLAFIVGGSALAFLIFNWYPAKIFPGDSGANILGFMIAVLAILSGAKLAAAALILLVPLIDFIYIFFRRIFSGHSPFLGDKKHLHHLLLKKGWTQQQISLFYILGSVILGAVALMLDSKEKLFAAILVSTIILGALLWLNFFGEYSKQQDPDSG